MSSRSGGAPKRVRGTRASGAFSRNNTASVPSPRGDTRELHAARAANLAIWEDRLRKLPEGVSELHAFAMRNGVHQFSVRVGTGQSVNLTAEQVQQMQGAILSRNHHSGMPPSIEEAHAAYRANAGELRVVTPEGRYWLRSSSPARNPWSGPSFEGVRRAYDAASSRLMEQQTANIHAGRLSATQAESAQGRRTLEEATWRAVAADKANHLVFGYAHWPTNAQERRAGAAAFAKGVLAQLDKREQAAQRREASGKTGGGVRKPGAQQSAAQTALDRYVYDALRQMEQQARGAGPSGRGGRLPGRGRGTPKQTKPKGL